MDSKRLIIVRKTQVSEDYVAKFRVNSDADAKVYQSLTAKLQYSEDFANETYLGLTDDDYRKVPTGDM
jgi:Fe(3+) dicitrate transport protein